MPEPDPTAEPGASGTDKDVDKNDPTNVKDAPDTDATTGDDGDKKKDSGKKDQDAAAEDYEHKFKGLQPKYQTLVEEAKEHEDALLKLGGKIAELETTIASSGETIVKMNETAKEAEEGSDGLTKTNKELEGQLERSNLIMSDYPELAALEAKGLLPVDVEGDELKVKFDSMSEVLKEQGSSNVAEKVKGSTGEEDISTGGRSGGDSIDDTSHKILEANKTGDTKESARLTAILVEQQNKVFEQK